MELKANDPLILAAIAIIIIGAIILVDSTKANIGAPEPIVVDKSGFQKAPELTGLAGYINTDSNISLSALEGKVVLIDFWTYSCINCIRTIPYLNSWHEKYADDGLVIIGVHSPEFEFEKKKENVQNAVDEYNIKYQVVLDNDFATWRAYANRYWPHKFLVDAQGYIRYDHIGEGSYGETEEKIVELLKEKNSAPDDQMGLAEIEGTDFSKIATPEIYFGYNFFRPQSPQIGNIEGVHTEQQTAYEYPSRASRETFRDNTPYLGGTWTVLGDYSKLNSETGMVGLVFTAKKANIVAGAPKGAQLTIMLDGAQILESEYGSDVELADGKPIVRISEQRLYNIVDAKNYSKKTLEFKISGEGFELYTFTFG
ncbi:MAG: thioredoxin family protein, partial [archaeon]|nr:thioredoxin family protein [archaeon]